MSSFKDLQQLCTELKDGLALKMLAGLQQSVGLTAPLGLHALPAELKTKILASLQVLLNLIYTCQRMNEACKLLQAVVVQAANPKFLVLSQPG